jgi:hypothetical protein
MTWPGADGALFAGTSLRRHLARGALGFGALAGSLALLPVVGAVSLLLLPAGLVALRGCPMCWTAELVQRLSRGRLERSCEDGRCRLTPAGGAPAAHAGDARRRARLTR